MLAVWAIDQNQVRTISSSLLWAIVVLTVVLLAVAALLVVLGRWIKGSRSDSSSSGSELATFRSLYERGECSREEYEQIRARLSQKLKKELQLPGKPKAESPAEQPPAESPPEPPAPEPPAG